MCISQGLRVQEDSRGGWNPACPPPAQPPTAAQVFFDPINRAFSQICLPGHRPCTLRWRLPIEQVTESLNRLSVALMKAMCTGFQVPSFFQKGEKVPSPCLIGSQSHQNMAAVFPRVASGIHTHPAWYRNQILSTLCASGLILPTASIISRLLSGAFRVACQAPKPQGGHSVLWESKPLNMPLEYFSHFKKGYGSRECPATAFKSGPCWALIWQVSPSD